MNTLAYRMGAPKIHKLKSKYKVIFAPIRYTPIERVCVRISVRLSVVAHNLSTTAEKRRTASFCRFALSTVNFAKRN